MITEDHGSNTYIRNPNNCATCKHKLHPDGGWCYMFRHEPIGVCHQHTSREIAFEWLDSLLSDTEYFARRDADDAYHRDQQK